MIHRDWHWVIRGDETRAWSSAARNWVSTWPVDRVTIIASTAELNDVLAQNGLPPCEPQPMHVKEEAGVGFSLLTLSGGRPTWSRAGWSFRISGGRMGRGRLKSRPRRRRSPPHGPGSGLCVHRQIRSRQCTRSRGTTTRIAGGRRKRTVERVAALKGKQSP